MGSAFIDLGGGVVTKLVDWTCSGVPAQAETPCLNQGGSFSNRICAADNKTDAKTGIAQALFNDQRMERQEPSSEINFSTQLGQRHQIYSIAGSSKREGFGNSRRNINELSENKGVIWPWY